MRSSTLLLSPLVEVRAAAVGPTLSPLMSGIFFAVFNIHKTMLSF
jgi:hypothetical protein